MVGVIGGGVVLCGIDPVPSLNSVVVRLWPLWNVGDEVGDPEGDLPFKSFETTDPELDDLELPGDLTGMWLGFPPPILVALFDGLAEAETIRRSGESPRSSGGKGLFLGNLNPKCELRPRLGLSFPSGVLSALPYPFGGGFSGVVDGIGLLGRGPS